MVKIENNTLRQVDEWINTFKSTEDLITDYSDRRRNYYRRLKTFSTFGKGWLRRVDETEIEALRLSLFTTLEDIMTFIHEPVEVTELKTKNINRKRFYETPEGKLYPSITTVLQRKENGRFTRMEKQSRS